MHTEGGLEVARVVKNMLALKVLDLNGSCSLPFCWYSPSMIASRQLFWSRWNRWDSKSVGSQTVCQSDGIQVKEKETSHPTLVSSGFSDDEGSDDDETGEGEEGNDDEEGEGDGYEDEDEEEEDDDDDAYEDEDDEEEDVESPSFFFGNNPIQQQAWNTFKFTAPKTPSSQPETTNDLSSMIANFNVCSPFSFGSPTTAAATTTATISQTNENKWTRLTQLEKVKEHLQVSSLSSAWQRSLVFPDRWSVCWPCDQITRRCLEWQFRIRAR